MMCLQGTIWECSSTVGHGKYRIQFDDGAILECFSNRLGMECASASIPPDAHPLQVDFVGTNLPLAPKKMLRQTKSRSLNPSKIPMKKKSTFFLLRMGIPIPPR